MDKRNRKQWKRINVEQNPLDKKEFLQGLRESWAAECNKYLSPDLQIDHRSNEARGLEEEPTIHEGYVARQIEKEGGISERCEFNRDTKERNGLIYQFKQLVNQVKELIYETIHRSRSVRTDQGIRSEQENEELRKQISELSSENYTLRDLLQKSVEEFVMMQEEDLPPEQKTVPPISEEQKNTRDLLKKTILP